MVEPRLEHFQFGIPCIASHALLQSFTKDTVLHGLELLWLGYPNKAGRENFRDSQHLKIATGHCSFVPNSGRMKEILIIQLALDK